MRRVGDALERVRVRVRGGHFRPLLTTSGRCRDRDVGLGRRPRQSSTGRWPCDVKNACSHRGYLSFLLRAKARRVSASACYSPAFDEKPKTSGVAPHTPISTRQEGHTHEGSSRSRRSSRRAVRRHSQRNAEGRLEVGGDDSGFVGSGCPVEASGGFAEARRSVASDAGWSTPDAESVVVIIDLSGERWRPFCLRRRGRSFECVPDNDRYGARADGHGDLRKRAARVWLDVHQFRYAKPGQLRAVQVYPLTPFTQPSLTLAGAMAAAASEDLHEWLQVFLRSPEGLNVSLADHFELTQPRYERPEMIELSRMTPITGPDPSFRWQADPDQWEADISAKAAALEAGWEPPPLVADRQSLVLSDGNRRYEALRRCGQLTYWTILFF